MRWYLYAGRQKNNFEVMRAKFGVEKNGYKVILQLKRTFDKTSLLTKYTLNELANCDRGSLDRISLNRIS